MAEKLMADEAFMMVLDERMKRARWWERILKMNSNERISKSGCK
jgi:hypothetical protein